MNNMLNYVGTADQKDRYHWDLSGLDPSEIVQNPNTTRGPLVFNLINKPQTKIALQVISKYGCKSATVPIVVKYIDEINYTKNLYRIV